MALVSGSGTANLTKATKNDARSAESKDFFSNQGKQDEGVRLPARKSQLIYVEFKIDCDVDLAGWKPYCCSVIFDSTVSCSWRLIIEAYSL